MIRHELHRWVRSRRLALLVLAFVFSGVTSALTAAYLPEILGAVSGAGVQVTVADPTWQDLVAAYFKNSSQLALLFSCYLAAWACSLGSDDRLRIYYLARSRRAADVHGPRLLLTTGVVSVAVLLGAGAALYATVALVDGTDVGRAVPALLVQASGLLAFSMMAACLACTRIGAGLATGTVVALALVGSALHSVEGVATWSPTILLGPTGLLQDQGPGDYVRPLLLAVLLLAGLVTVSLLRTVRHLAPAGPSAIIDAEGAAGIRPSPTHHQPQDVMTCSGPAPRTRP